MDTRKPIPDSTWATIRQLESSEQVKAAVALDKRSGIADLMLCIEADHDGWFIISFPEHDLWMLQHPDGKWEQCYIGQDEDFNKEVLEEKYRLRHLLDTHIQSFDGIRRVYIEP